MNSPAASHGYGVDLATSYLGLSLRSPLVASAGPVTQNLDRIRGLADAGAGAVVLPSLFEEQIKREAERDTRLAETGTDSVGEALTYLPDIAGDIWPRPYLGLIERAAAAAGIPVIASLNGVTTGGWTGYARTMQDAGAAAIELNIYYLPGDPLVRPRDAEHRYLDVLASVKAAVSVPVAVKLAPYFSSFGEMAARLDRAGADGIVMFNRFMQTDIDPETFGVTTGFKLSSPSEAALPRSWIARLRRQLGCSLAASTGVEDAGDVAAYLLAGADVVMSTSALLRHGPEHAAVLLEGLAGWMARKGFKDIGEFRGMLAAGADGSRAYDRVGYLTAVQQASRAYGSRLPSRRPW